MTIGICSSTYSPLLRGELDLIMQAKKQNDRCIIFAPEEAAVRLRALFSESREVEVRNEGELPELLPLLREDGAKLHWYIRKQEEEAIGRWADASDELTTGGDDTTPADRQRETDRPCRRIMITGWASEGKSTLARDIAAYFQIPYVPEAARVYMEARKLKDEELTEADFLEFIRLQNRLTDEGTDRVAVVDTDNITTLAYTISYAADPDVSAITEESIRKIRSEVRVYDWQRIYVLPPKNTYVDDGLRYMKQADLEVRNENFELLLRLLDEYGLSDRITFLTGNYWENFLQVKNDVKEWME